MMAATEGATVLGRQDTVRGRSRRTEEAVVLLVVLITVLVPVPVPMPLLSVQEGAEQVDDGEDQEDEPIITALIEQPLRASPRC